MFVRFAKKFRKQYHKAPKNIQDAFDTRLALFQDYSFHPLLDNHGLTGEFQGLRSISITGDWRAVFSENDENGLQVILFHLIGTHSQLYR